MAMAYQVDEAQREFDRWSGTYDINPLQLFFFAPAHRMLLGALSPGDQRILDIGCGTGIFASRVLEHLPGAHVWGLDLSDGMLQRSRARCHAAPGRLHLVRGNSERLPFSDNSFDVVTCAHSFHHYPCQDRVVAEMHRVLRPGGGLFIIDGDRDRLWGHLLYDILVVSVEGQVRHVPSRIFRQMYRQAGFTDVRQHRRRGPLPMLLTTGRAVKTPDGEPGA
jgi:ubiquinone/menaquinone biosynthesis C-methylase UbiE